MRAMALLQVEIIPTACLPQAELILLAEVLLQAATSVL